MLSHQPLPRSLALQLPFAFPRAIFLRRQRPLLDLARLLRLAPLFYLGRPLRLAPLPQKHLLGQQPPLRRLAHPLSLAFQLANLLRPQTLLFDLARSLRRASLFFLRPRLRLIHLPDAPLLVR